MKKRNSLIELYRFFFALNVVKSHGFFPEGLNLFSPGRVSVEFFFVLSGYLFLRTLEKLEGLPLKNSLPKLIVAKLKPLAFPLIIGLLSNIVYNIVTKEYFSGIWGYLWYVEAMMIVFVAYLILKRIIKNEKTFYCVVLGVFIAATLLRFSGVLYRFGYIRAASTISLGMLLARVPQLNIRRKWIGWVLLAPIAAACFLVVCFHLGNVEWWGGFMGIELILDCVLYPALIYLTFNVKLESRVLNYLGSLSFGLYAFQCPLDLARLFGLGNRWVLLSSIVFLAIAENLVKRILQKRKNKAAPINSPP